MWVFPLFFVLAIIAVTTFSSYLEYKRRMAKNFQHDEMNQHRIEVGTKIVKPNTYKPIKKTLTKDYQSRKKESVEETGYEEYDDFFEIDENFFAAYDDKE